MTFSITSAFDSGNIRVLSTTDSGADLYVVFVDEFTNPSSSEEWANTVASDNGLGPSQYLLAVATEGRQYYLSADSSGPLSEEEVAGIEADVRPYLSDGDYAGAMNSRTSR